jgi:hypothetical protein
MATDNRGEERIRHFNHVETAIRDSYHRFLDGLTTFASYVDSGLVSVRSLHPYLSYRLRNMQRPTLNPNDAAWRAALITYTRCRPQGCRLRMAMPTLAMATGSNLLAQPANQALVYQIDGSRITVGINRAPNLLVLHRMRSWRRIYLCRMFAPVKDYRHKKNNNQYQDNHLADILTPWCGWRRHRSSNIRWADGVNRPQRHWTRRIC